MFYQLMRFLLKQAYRVYYRRIYVSGLENIPKNKPVIYASNHPNSFKDAVVIGICVERPMTTLVRSDVFKSKFARWALSLWRLVPVYRIQEGAENLKKNDHTFTICKEILKNKGTVLIFSEGICITEKRLRPLKKGTARIALGASEEIDEIYIVPTGVNYSYLTGFHNDLMVSFGKPIKVADYLKEYAENQAKAITRITADLRQAMANEIVIIEKKETEQLTETFLKINRSFRPDSLFPWKQFDRSRLEMEMNTAKKVNELFTENPEKFSALSEKAIRYSDLLTKQKLEDDYLITRKRFGSMRFVLLLIGLPLYLLGKIINTLPMALGEKIADKKVTIIEFYASVRLGAGYILYVIIYFALLLSLLCFHNPLYIAFVLMLPFISIIASAYQEALNEVTTSLKHKKFATENSKEYQVILTLRNEIINELYQGK